MPTPVSATTTTASAPSRCTASVNYLGRRELHRVVEEAVDDDLQTALPSAATISSGSAVKSSTSVSPACSAREAAASAASRVSAVVTTSPTYPSTPSPASMRERRGSGSGERFEATRLRPAHEPLFVTTLGNLLRKLEVCLEGRERGARADEPSPRTDGARDGGSMAAAMAHRGSAAAVLVGVRTTAAAGRQAASSSCRSAASVSSATGVGGRWRRRWPAGDRRERDGKKRGKRPRLGGTHEGGPS